MELLLQRQPSTKDCTIGRLSVNGVFQCWTLEDEVRHGPKIAHETAIPAGRYPITITMSQRFGVPLPVLCDVPDFTGIRIHPGNTEADTSGCILVGQLRGQASILNSRIALAALQPKLASALAHGEPVWIEISDATPRG